LTEKREKEGREEGEREGGTKKEGVPSSFQL